MMFWYVHISQNPAHPVTIDISIVGMLHKGQRSHPLDRSALPLWKSEEGMVSDRCGRKQINSPQV